MELNETTNNFLGITSVISCEWVRCTLLNSLGKFTNILMLSMEAFCSNSTSSILAKQWINKQNDKQTEQANVQ